MVCCVWRGYGAVCCACGVWVRACGVGMVCEWCEWRVVVCLFFVGMWVRGGVVVWLFWCVGI